MINLMIVEQRFFLIYWQFSQSKPNVKIFLLKAIDGNAALKVILLIIALYHCLGHNCLYLGTQ